jgi:hypothetical protein
LNRKSMRRLRGAALVAMVAGAVALVGSAQATTSTKTFDASVVPAAVPGAGTAQLTFTLTNDSSSQQTLGSANFTAPTGWSASTTSTQQVLSTVNQNKWNACSGDGTTCLAPPNNVVQFRAASSGDALAPGDSVHATFTVQTACSLSTNATWHVDAKQSNDFSGRPGNGFLAGTTDLQPLGSFSIGLNPTQPTTAGPFTITATALDTCGTTKTNYNGAAPYAGSLVTTGLDGASGFQTWGGWSNGANSETITPLVAQSGNTAAVGDTVGGPVAVITKTLTFAVLDTVCTGSCHFGSNGNTASSPIQIDSKVPGGAVLGLGFNRNVVLTPTYICGASTSAVDGLAALIAPSGYGANTAYTLTLTYSNALTNGRPVSSFAFCLSENGTTWSLPLPACPVVAPTPCVISQKRVPSGALQIVLQLYSNDPYGGLT